MDDMMCEIGSIVNQLLIGGNQVVCHECVVTNSRDLYITIEPVGSPFDKTHIYICRYIRKNSKKIIMKSMKTFVVHISLNHDVFMLGIDTTGVVDYAIINQCSKMLEDMHIHALSIIKSKKEFENHGKNDKG